MLSSCKAKHSIGKIDLRIYMTLHVNVWVQANIPSSILDFQGSGWD